MFGIFVTICDTCQNLACAQVGYWLRMVESYSVF